MTVVLRRIASRSAHRLGLGQLLEGERAVVVLVGAEGDQPGPDGNSLRAVSASHAL